MKEQTANTNEYNEAIYLSGLLNSILNSPVPSKISAVRLFKKFIEDTIKDANRSDQ